MLPWSRGFGALALLLSSSLACASPPSASFEAKLAPAIIIDGAEPHWTLQERMAFYHVPGVAIAIIRGYRIAEIRTYGVRAVGRPEPIDDDTLFSVGSLSKIPTALASLRLVEQGRLSLDRPINDYLRRWSVPANEFTRQSQVTLRGIMSHSAGLSVDGFPDFLPGERLPTIIDTLEGRPPSKTEAVRVQARPGSTMYYSGGGATVEQLAIEEVTNKPFVNAMDELVLRPLGMARSTYLNPLPERTSDVAHGHDDKGNPAALPRGWQTFPEMAAAGLWTSVTDYARFVVALMDAYRGAPGAILSRPLAWAMMTEVGPSTYGLGPNLDGEGWTRRFSHSGSNDSYRAWMEGHIATGDGLVILTNGALGYKLAREIRRAVAVDEKWNIGLPVHVPAVPIDSDMLARLPGRYVLPAQAPVTASRIDAIRPAYDVTRDGDRLVIHDDKKNKSTALIAEDPSHFIVEEGFIGDSIVPTRLEFVNGYDGRIAMMVIRHGGDVVEAARAP
jgi:CubicO group peptidase (beta-lactamase class C family)